MTVLICVPEYCKVLAAGISMKTKIGLVKRKSIKDKVRQYIHDGKQEYSVNYYGMFSPIITWTSLRLLLILSSINSWATFQVDYVLAFP